MNLLLIVTLLHWFYCVSGQLPKPAIRVRLNKGVFEQASSIVAGLVEYEVPRVRIPNTQQCFTEGCVQIHSFQMTSFRQPQSVSFQPSPPNQFRIRVTNFDFFVSGQLSGNIQVIINLPVSGTVYLTGQGISVTAFLDIQKTVGDEPYLRFLQCQIDSGFIDTRVADMGIFTDTVNSKYKALMSSQSRQQLEEAICSNMHRLTQQHFSSRMSHMPSSISAKQLAEMLISPSGKLELATEIIDLRSKRANDDYYDEMEKISPSTTPRPTLRPAPKTSPRNRPSGSNDDDSVVEGFRKVKFTASDLSNFFNVNRLAHLIIDMTLLDASSTTHDFSIGMAGSVQTTRSPGRSPFNPPFPFRLPKNNQRRMIEVVISDYTINSLLYHAHRTNSLLFHVDSHTPGVGGLLKTTCTVDEVCISDQVEEIGQKHPGKRLELIIRTVKAPTITFTHDTANIAMDGRILFFLEGTRQKVGVLPFSSQVRIRLNTVGSNLKGSISVTRLEFTEGLDFFGLTANDLDGFKSSTKTALENMANAALASGVPLSTANTKFPLRFSAAHVSVLPDVLLIQANVDLYNSLYDRNGAQTEF